MCWISLVVHNRAVLSEGLMIIRWRGADWSWDPLRRWTLLHLSPLWSVNVIESAFWGLWMFGYRSRNPRRSSTAMRKRGMAVEWEDCRASIRGRCTGILTEGGVPQLASTVYFPLFLLSFSEWIGKILARSSLGHDRSFGTLFLSPEDRPHFASPLSRISEWGTRDYSNGFTGRGNRQEDEKGRGKSCYRACQCSLFGDLGISLYRL